MNQSRRRADAARNDDLLLDAALELLREKGPDRIAALDLARLAKLTTGAVYARYENNEEILVGLWQHRTNRTTAKAKATGAREMGTVFPAWRT